VAPPFRPKGIWRKGVNIYLFFKKGGPFLKKTKGKVYSRQRNKENIGGLRGVKGNKNASP
jgi:hypothetical protein